TTAPGAREPAPRRARRQARRRGGPASHHPQSVQWGRGGRTPEAGRVRDHQCQGADHEARRDRPALCRSGPSGLDVRQDQGGRTRDGDAGTPAPRAIRRKGQGRRSRHRRRERHVWRAPGAAQPQRQHPGGGALPRAIPVIESTMRFLVACAVALLLSTADSARAAEATLSVEVPAARWKAVRLKNLPKGTSVALQIVASGAIRVIVVDSTELKRFPNTRPLFEATVDSRLGFSVVIPRSDDYYVVFDNRAATDARQVRMRVRAEAPRRTPPKPAPSP